MTRIWAVARNTIAQAVRNRVAFIIMGVYVVLVPILPFVIEGDGTLQGLLTVVIAYLLIAAGLLLKILTLAVSTTTLWTEIRDKQIFLLESKPIRRWEVLLGKLLGVLLIDTGLLAFVAVVSLICVQAIVHQDQWEPSEREAAQRQILAGRRIIQPEADVSDDEVRRHYEALDARHALPPDRTEAEIKAGIRAGMKAVSRVVPYRSQRIWRFHGARTPSGAPSMLSGRVTTGGQTFLTEDGRRWQTDRWRNMTLTITSGTGSGQIGSIAHNTADQLIIYGAWEVPPDATSRYRISPAPMLRFKYYRADAGDEEPLKCVWAFGVPRSQSFLSTGAIPFKAGEFHEIEVPADAVGKDGVLEVRLVNADPGNVSMVFAGDDVMQLLLPASGFTANLVRGLAVLAVQLFFLAVLGLFFSTFLDFPTAPIAALSVLLAIVMAGAIRPDLDKGYAFDRRDESAGYQVYKGVVTVVVHGVQVVFPPLDNYAPAPLVSAGFEVPWRLLAEGMGLIVILRGGVLMMLGMVFFHSRELAAHQR